MDDSTFENLRYFYSDPFRHEATVSYRTLVLFIPFVENKVWDAGTPAELHNASREALTLLDKHFHDRIGEDGSWLSSRALACYRACLAGDMAKTTLMSRALAEEALGSALGPAISDEDWLSRVRWSMDHDFGDEFERPFMQYTNDELFQHVTPFAVLRNTIGCFYLNVLLALDYVDRDRDLVYDLKPQLASAHSRR